LDGLQHRFVPPPEEKDVNYRRLLLDKIADHSSRAGIIGLGYVGLPLATAFASAPYRIAGINLDQRKVDTIGRSESCSPGVPGPLIAEPVGSGWLAATAGYGVLADLDAVSNWPQVNWAAAEADGLVVAMGRSTHDLRFIVGNGGTPIHIRLALSARAHWIETAWGHDVYQASHHRAVMTPSAGRVAGPALSDRRESW